MQSHITSTGKNRKVINEEKKQHLSHATVGSQQQTATPLTPLTKQSKVNGIERLFPAPRETATGSGSELVFRYFPLQSAERNINPTWVNIQSRTHMPCLSRSLSFIRNDEQRILSLSLLLSHQFANSNRIEADARLLLSFGPLEISRFCTSFGLSPSVRCVECRCCWFAGGGSVRVGYGGRGGS